MLRDKKNQRILVAIFIVVVVVLIVTIVLFISESNKPKVKIKSAISEKIDRTDFDVNDIAVEDGNWLLVKISSTNRNDRGNNAFSILKKEGGVYNVVLGPGTGFTGDDIVNVGAPKSIVKYLLGNGPHFTGFNRLRANASRSNCVDVVSQLAIAYAERKQTDVFIFKMLPDSYRKEPLTNRPKFNDMVDYFDITLDDKETIHIKIITPYDGAIVYELYDENNKLIFRV
jgi:uncharacterized protein YpmB